MLGPWGSRVGSGGLHWVIEGLRWVHDTNMLVFPMQNGRVGGLN